MREISLDGGEWRTERDFFDALADALGSPDWHGRNPDAFIDSMIYNIEMHDVRPPYQVVVRNIPAGLRPFLTDFAGWIEESKQDRSEDAGWDGDVEVSVGLEVSRPSPNTRSASPRMGTRYSR